MTKEKGFTLIELIIVIVILGALAVVALPRFVDLQGEAEQAAAEGVAGALGSASAINFASAKAGATSDGITECTDTQFTTILQDPDTLADYSISGEDADTQGATDEGDAFTCTVSDDDNNSASADFQAIRVD